MGAKADVIITMVGFVLTFIGWWWLPGYSEGWDPDKLRRMAVIRVGFGVTIGLAGSGLFVLMANTVRNVWRR